MRGPTAMLSLLLAFVLVGCQNPTPVASDTPSVPERDAVPVTPSSPVASTTDPKVSQPPVNADDNPYRVFQLKDLQVVKVKIGEHEFDMWVMDTFAKRQEGMMFLRDEDVKPNQGMLFVFPEPAEQNFWMKNTLIDLDILYIGADKRVLNILTMKALDTTTPYPSKGKAMWVIELKAGVAKEKELKAGMTVEIPDGLKAED